MTVYPPDDSDLDVDATRGGMTFCRFEELARQFGTGIGCLPDVTVTDKGVNNRILTFKLQNTGEPAVALAVEMVHKKHHAYDHVSNFSFNTLVVEADECV